MNEYVETDRQKLIIAIQCIRKTLKCTLCDELPKDTVAAKCGHPICKTCVDGVLHTKRAVCSICKTVIIHSSIHRLESVDKIVKDLRILCKAIEKDSGISICLDKPQVITLNQGKRRSLALPGPLSSKIRKENSSKSACSTEKPGKRYNGRKMGAKKIEKRESIHSDSDRTVKIFDTQLIKKNEDVEPSTSRVTSNVSEAIFATDHLAIGLNTVQLKEKVEDWLYSEKFDEKILGDAECFENVEPPASSSSGNSEILESFSQARPDTNEFTKNGRNSRASTETKKSRRGSVSTANNSLKYKSFTSEARNKMKKPVPRDISPVENMVNGLSKITSEKQPDSKKSRAPSISTETSWSELALFKKETRPRVRKRRRLNVSIERPSSSKQFVDSSARDDSRKENEIENRRGNSMEEDADKKNTQFDKEIPVVLDSAKKKTKLNLVSSITLNESEMFDVQKLSRYQLKEIIGITCPQGNLDTSKNSSNSLDRSSVKSTGNKLFLMKSGENGRDNSNESIPPHKPEEEATTHFEESIRSQSKQSFNVNDSRPDSRLSCQSTAKSGSEKFRLSTKKLSPISNTGTLKLTLNPTAAHPKEDQQEKIVLGSDTPIRTYNNFIKNKFPLKRVSSENSRTSLENKKSTIVSIKKLGKLVKQRSRIKFLRLGSLRLKPTRREFENADNSSRVMIKLRDAQTQTSPMVDYGNNIPNYASRSFTSNESLVPMIIPETRATCSIISRDSKQIEEVRGRAASSTGKTATLHESPEKLNTSNKVNLLSPDKDSQLKYFATKSPSVARMDYSDSECSTQRINEYHLLPKKTSSTNSGKGLLQQETDEYKSMERKFVEKLIVTDSEDQDMLSENIGAIKLQKNHQVEENRLKRARPSVTISSMSKTSSSILEMKMDDEIETAASRDVMNVKKSPSLRSVASNSEAKLAHASPRRKRNSKNLLRSQTKKRSASAQKLKLKMSISRSYLDDYPQSDAESILLKETRNKEADQHFENSEPLTMNARHRVVRKLKYSQESQSNPSSKLANSESLEQQGEFDKDKKKNELSDKKNFQRIRQISSTDSEGESLEISLPTKESSRNSQIISKPEVSQKTNESPLLSEEMTVVFSPNKETQESKRKRSPSPNSLDNNDLQAIASNWCADLDRSSEEIAVATNIILGLAKNHASKERNPKKLRLSTHDSPASLDSDRFPVLGPTAIYGNTKKNDDTIENVTEINNRCLSNTEKSIQSTMITMSELCKDEGSELIDDLDQAAAQFDDINTKIQPEKNEHTSSGTTNFTSTNNTGYIGIAANTEYSIKRGNTFNGIVATNKLSTPMKAKSMDDRDISSLHCSSHNSDKENELGSWGGINRPENKVISARSVQKIVSKEDSNKLLNCKHYVNPEPGTRQKSNYQSVPSKSDARNNVEPLESSFDRDYLNITQEQILMQEVEENLLGRKSGSIIKGESPKAKQDKAMEKLPNTNIDKSSPQKKPMNNSADQEVKGYRVAELISDDSSTLDEDVIESTPEKNVQSKKDLCTLANNSQRSNMSLKSFMSVDMTPIAKTSNLYRNLSAHPSRHSTPKATTSFAQKSKLLIHFARTKTEKHKESKLCFVCSCLTLPQVQNVKTFALRHNIEYTVSYEPQVTHVIVQTNEQNSASRTLKYLLGVAHKKWIVSYKWVTDSMSQGRLLEEEDYEAVDSDTEEPGPRRSRLSNKGLFDKFAFACMQPFSDITFLQLQDLISSTGGTVVETLEELASVSNKYKVILYNTDLHEPAVLDSWRQQGCGLPVQIEWVLSCISQYELVSFRYYLHSADRELVLNLDFPPELVRKEEDSSSLNEESPSKNG